MGTRLCIRETALTTSAAQSSLISLVLSGRFPARSFWGNFGVSFCCHVIGLCADLGTKFRRGLGLLLPLALMALLLVPASPAAAAEEPALTSFERTSPAVVEAGGTVSFSFTTSVPVKGVQVELKDAAGSRYARWTSADGVLAGTVSTVAVADAWPSGPVQLSYIGLDLVSGVDQWYYRDGRTVPAETLAPSFGSLALRDFETSNPGVVFQDPGSHILLRQRPDPSPRDRPRA